jgi:hypothetical protein
VKYTLDHFKAKARAAYDAGTLIPQMYPSENPDYVVGNPPAYCGIGAGLTPEDLAKVMTHQADDDDYFGVSILIADHIIQVEPGIREGLSEIQQAHDLWTKAPSRVTERAFLKAIEQ